MTEDPTPSSGEARRWSLPSIEALLLVGSVTMSGAGVLLLGLGLAGLGDVA